MDDWINITYFGMLFHPISALNKTPQQITGATPATKLSAIQAMSKAMKDFAQPSIRR